MSGTIKHKSVVLRILLILVILINIPCVYLYSQNKAPIIIVSSYNPEAASISSYISNFLNEYRLKENDRAIIIENMNCKALSESMKWRNMMASILRKFASMDPKPAVIIMLGQEAFTSYLSQPTSSLCGIPVMCGMVSRNTVRFPNSSFDSHTIELQCTDAFQFAKSHHIVGGYLYQYDLEKNIELIKHFYPDTRKLAFITDNSCGGICMHSYINMVMKKHPEYQYIPLDGRLNTVYSMINQLAKLRDKTVLILGSWRMDKNEGFFMHNSVYLMKDVNPKLPAFSISTIGVGDWAIGGYVPSYRNTGKELASQVYDYIHLKNHGNSGLKVLPNKYVFDAEAIAQYGLKLKSFPKDAEYVNKTESFWTKYQRYIIAVSIAFVVLTSVIFILIYSLLKTNKLKNALIQSHRELLAAKEKAEESNKMERAFVANMSHEIRTPLNAIVGFSNLLTTSTLSETERTEFTSIIQQNSDLLLNLINDILDLSRMESSYTEFEFENVNIVEFCKSVLLTAKVAKQSTLEYKFESRFAYRAELLDVKHTQQVLINLLSNAGKFTTKGSITLIFDVDEKKKWMYFTVKDTGCGIPEDKREKIFDRFAKLNTYAQGTGLGLSICRIIVEQLGGKIWVDPDYKDGSSFIFYIPIKK